MHGQNLNASSGLSFCILGLSLLVGTLIFFPSAPARESADRDLIFEERVRAQEAIDRVYYSHQIGATRSFEDAVPQAVLQAKVAKYLRQSAALEELWKTPITGVMLSRETERMVQGTRMPERLGQLFAALSNDALLVEECLARPVLVERLIRNFYAFDQDIHLETRQAIDALRTELVQGSLDPYIDDHRRIVRHLVRLDPDQKETYLVDGPPAPPDLASVAARVELSAGEFDRRRQQLPDRMGDVSDVVEERDRFVVQVLLDEKPQELHVATYVVKKTAWDSWWQTIEEHFDEHSVRAVSRSSVHLPVPQQHSEYSWSPDLDLLAATGDASAAQEGACAPDDTWYNGNLSVLPSPRQGHSVVWTGYLVVVWGGDEDAGAGSVRYVNTGGRYDPVIDAWLPMTTIGAPPGRRDHTAVFGGNRMLVWGGRTPATTNTGGVYDPLSDTWSSMTSAGAPTARYEHTTIWSDLDGKMVVWGGYDGGYSGTGGAYHLASDTWSPTSTGNAPEARRRHTAVWTGDKMIIWGGRAASGYVSNGGFYVPGSDSWGDVATAGAPSTRVRHSAAWVNGHMVVWGGSWSGAYLSTGARYNPASNQWFSTNTAGAPDGRERHTAVSTGTEMIVWGGSNDSGSLDSGGTYDPLTDSWSSMTATGAPSARRLHGAAWAPNANAMIVWGGYGSGRLNTGGSYDPGTNTWTPTSISDAPTARRQHSSVWTGNEMVVWGGYDGTFAETGGRYNPATESWASMTTTGAPEGRYEHSTIWTGQEMIVWGGDRGYPIASGGRYNPLYDTWTPVNSVGAPTARSKHAASWATDQMIVWGGYDGTYTNTGGRYDPTTDTWSPTQTAGAPVGSHEHTAVWTDSRLLVWGGHNGTYLDSGGVYNPVDDSWASMATLDAPAARSLHTAVWADTEMIVWGGYDGSIYVDTGGRYDPATDEWNSTSTVNAPSGRGCHPAVWTGDLMLVWGGGCYTVYPYVNTGGRYDPVTDTWTATSLIEAPIPRSHHTAVFAPAGCSSMLIWGGYSPDWLNGGGRYSLGESADGDGDGYSEAAGDCDDQNPAIFPSAPEVCDDIENQCSGDPGHGLIDEGCDDDGDDYCDSGMGVNGSPPACPNGGGDCDDDNPLVHPGALELCDSLDNDCNAHTDEACVLTLIRNNDIQSLQPVTPSINTLFSVGTGELLGQQSLQTFGYTFHNEDVMQPTDGPLVLYQLSDPDQTLYLNRIDDQVEFASFTGRCGKLKQEDTMATIVAVETLYSEYLRAVALFGVTDFLGSIECRDDAGIVGFTTTEKFIGNNTLAKLIFHRDALTVPTAYISTTRENQFDFFNVLGGFRFDVTDPLAPAYIVLDENGNPVNQSAEALAGTACLDLNVSYRSCLAEDQFWNDYAQATGDDAFDWREHAICFTAEAIVAHAGGPAGETAISLYCAFKSGVAFADTIAASWQALAHSCDLDIPPDAVCPQADSGCGVGTCIEDAEGGYARCDYPVGGPCTSNRGCGGPGYCNSVGSCWTDPEPEICDNEDNDCNAATGDGAEEQWFGVYCDGVDSDFCEEGLYLCIDGAQYCTDGSGDSVEICDGLDNDCDGSYDEGLPGCGMIDVLFPDGGETLYKGTEYQIQWNTNGVSGNVRIDLYKNGLLELPLAADDPNDGSYPFNPPPSLDDASDYMIRISAEGDSVVDFSASNFTITSHALPDLTVGAIAGPTAANVGNTVGVTLRVDRSGDSLVNGTFVLGRVYISTDTTITTSDTLCTSDSDPQMQYPNSTLNSSGTLTRVVDCTLPATAGNYYFGAIVDAADFHPESNETNNSLAGNSFAIGRLTVTSPNGGENWQAGTTHDITWTSSNVTGNIQIQPYLNGVPQTNIEPSAPNTGTYSWAIPSGYSTGSSYQMTVRAMGGAVYDFSDGNFTISSPVLPDLAVGIIAGPTAANVGNTVGVTLRVDRSGGSLVNGTFVLGRVYLSIDATITTSDTLCTSDSDPQMQYPNSTLNSSGTLTRVVDCTLPATAGNYYFGAIVDAADFHPESNETNNSLTGNSVAIGKLTVTSPNGIENWQAGTTHNITWTSSNVSGNIQIQPYLNGVPQTNIEPSAPNTGSYSWAIPSDYPTGPAYQMTVSAMSGAVYDFSDGNFTISAPALPDLTVATVAGPTTANAGNTVDVTVQVNRTGAPLTNGTFTLVRVYLSTNTTITTSDVLCTDDADTSTHYPNSMLNASGTLTRQLSCTLPDVGQNYYFGAIVDAVNYHPESNELNNTRVGNQVQIGKLTILSPNGGQNWSLGTLHNIAWSSSNVSGTVLIQPYLNGESQAPIATSTDNDGLFPWIIPSDYPTGTTYRIGISAIGGAVFDFSDGDFTISP